MRRAAVTTILLIVPLFLTGCSLKGGAPKTTPTPGASAVSGGSTKSADVPSGTTYLTVAPTALEPTIKANYDLAQAKVKDWHQNAVLYQISAKIPANLAIGQVTEVYTYGSADEAYNWWTLSVSDKTDKSVRAIIPKEDYLGTTLAAVPLQHWKMNYVEALQLAEVNGGSQFRAAHSDTQVTVNLAVGEPKGYLWWSVEYESTAASYKVLVNPSSKEVIAPPK